MVEAAVQLVRHPAKINIDEAADILAPKFRRAGLLLRNLQEVGAITDIEAHVDSDGYISGYFLKLSGESAIVESPLVARGFLQA